MFDHHAFAHAITNAADQLRSAEAALSALGCPEINQLSINLADLSGENIEELLENIPTGFAKKDKKTDFIYIIAFSPLHESDLNGMRDLLEDARRTDNDLPRINAISKATKALYVGRSKTLRGRLRQHLGADNRGVYSLHLQRWATCLTFELTIYFMRFDGADNLLVQAVEDGIWASLSPAFGRKGER